MEKKKKFYRISRRGQVFVSFLCLVAAFAVFQPAACAGAPLAIDLQAIRLIESSNVPDAVNEATGCYGLYQISEICLEDFNQIQGTEYRISDLFDPRVNEQIASWYFRRIAQMLAHFDIPVTLTTVLASYNWGIGHVVSWYRGGAAPQELPRETRRYLDKYVNLISRSAVLS